MKTSHVTDYVEDQEIKLENKEEQLSQLKETLEGRETKLFPERQVEKDEDGIVFDSNARTKSNDRAERAQESGRRGLSRF